MDKRSAKSIGGLGKASGYVVPKQRNTGRVRGVAHRQSSARVVAVGRIAERRVGPKAIVGRSMAFCAPKPATCR